MSELTLREQLGPAVKQMRSMFDYSDLFGLATLADVLNVEICIKFPKEPFPTRHEAGSQ